MSPIPPWASFGDTDMVFADRRPSAKNHVAFVSVVSAFATSFSTARTDFFIVLALGETQPFAALFAARLGRSAAQG